MMIIFLTHIVVYVIIGVEHSNVPLLLTTHCVDDDTVLSETGESGLELLHGE